VRFVKNRFTQYINEPLMCLKFAKKMHSIRASPFFLPGKRKFSAESFEPPPGTPGGAGGEAAVAATIECLESLARTLFSHKFRSSYIVLPWISHPIAPADSEAPGAPAPLSWKEKEAKRQRLRLEKAKRAGKGASGLLYANTSAAREAAVGNIGRRGCRQTNATSISSACTKQPRPANEGPVTWLCDVFCALLTEPVRFMWHNKDHKRMFLYPFGMQGRCRRFCVPDTLLTPDELVQLQFLAASSATWVDPDASTTHGHGETLVAGREANDAFELAFDRVGAVGLLCSEIAKHTVHMQSVRSVMECALMAAAGNAECINAGYHESMLQLAHSVRFDQTRESSLSSEKMLELSMRSQVFIMQNGVELVDPAEYEERIHRDARVK